MDSLLLQSGLRVINKYNEVTKKPRYYGTDVLMYPSEIHIIDAIGNGKDVTATSLAAQLGITKGGVSQSVAKLYGKELISKSAGNGINEVFLHLTPKGMTAYEGHKNLHKHMNDRIENMIANMDDGTKEEIQNLMAALEEELSLMGDLK